MQRRSNGSGLAWVVGKWVSGRISVSKEADLSHFNANKLFVKRQNQNSYSHLSLILKGVIVHNANR